MATTIVGFTATAGGGKSEAASHLVDEHGFTLVKFAGPLKAMLAGYYRELGADEELIHRKIEGDLKEEPCGALCGRTPRHAMQTLGTEWGREQMAPDFWTQAFSYSARQVDGPVVCDDVRFNNEADTIAESGGMVLKLEPKVKRRKKSTHKAEEGIDPSKVLATIKNDGTIAQLRQKLSIFLSGFNWI